RWVRALDNSVSNNHVPKYQMPKVAIVGRPNVGKSSLFNRLVGRREAIVADQPGVTRDVKTATVEHDERRFELLDTGGLWSGDSWEKAIKQRVDAAIHDTDLILFCVDGRESPTAADYEIAEWLRTVSVPVMLIATKIDDERHEDTSELYEHYGLGFDAPFTISAAHARGTLELLAEVLAKLPEGDDEADTEAVKVAIVGRPNVGKSSMLNALVGDARVIVADEAGTTRDSVDVNFEFGGRPFVLVDTAGIRRKPSENVEYYSKLRSELAIERADVAILVIDPFELGDHELRIANLAYHAGKPVVVALNKWDLVTDEVLPDLQRDLDYNLFHLQNAPKVTTSTLTEEGLYEVLSAAIRVYDRARVRVVTSDLNTWLGIWAERQKPPNFKGKPLKLLYVSQVSVAPPTFLIFVNNEQFVTRPYEQYLLNRIREDLGFSEVPIRLIFKARDGSKRVRI
ncbi:MAG: ribosome biogenesis GTPase Der, partial [Deinococcota bacterium]